MSVPPAAKPRRKARRQTPQETVRQFWDKLNTKYPGKVFTVLPDNPYARKKAAKTPHGTVSGQRAAKSYEEARAECERDVERITKECRRLNQKYRDTHFDIEWDLKSGQRNCLDGLYAPGDSMKPKGVKRVTARVFTASMFAVSDIFEKPQFYINGPTAGDVRQGRDGDCYLMAALCGLGNMEGLIDKVCVKHDLQVGVYGFVFFRDGEWQHTIIDDKLYLRAPDYDEAHEERDVWDDINRVDSAEEYRKTHQTGSRALYFAQCSDENETWLPLLEKAYAKAHGDFESIDGGFTGEAIEDLTGGVTTEIYSTDILDRDAFWRDELMQVGKQFLFGCATGFYSNWLDTSVVSREREGISEGHAYSIMDARDVNGQRLLKLRNPWGKKEWTGKWSDGSSEWDADWMGLLDHKFGNDGVFWISYDDLLKKYQHFDRTRIFGSEWHVTQCWTSLSVSWSAEYHSTKFSLVLEEKAPVVIVLAQLDDTYFSGLEGGYGFDLHFRLESDEKEDANDYIVRSNGNYAMARSVSTDIELEKGTYSVLMRITATRHTDKDHLEDVLPVYAATRREKLIQMGLSYDLAHAKGVHMETEAEKQDRKKRRKAQRARDREKLKAKLKAQAEKDWKRAKERHKRDKEIQARNKRRKERKQKANEIEIVQDANGSQHLPTRQNTVDCQQNADQLVLFDGRKSESPKINETDARPEQGQQPEVVKIKSDAGEDIGIEKMADKTDEILEPVTGFESVQTNKPIEKPSAEDVVQPLEDVIKRADEGDKADQTQPDSVPIEGSTTQPSKNVTSKAEAEAEADKKPSTSEAQADGVDGATDSKSLPIRARISMTQQANGSTDSDALSRNMNESIGNASGQSHRRPQRSDTLDTTAAMIGIGTGASEDSLAASGDRDTFIVIRQHQAHGDRGPMPDGDDDISDTDSFPPFDWNTDIDMSPESSSSDEDQQRGRYHRTAAARHRRRTSRPGPIPVSPPPGPINIDGDRTDDGGDGPDEQWNAVCVVGLRVYSTLQGEGVKLKVVKPREEDESEAEGEREREPEDLDLNDADDEEAGKGERAGLGIGNEAKLDPDDISKGAVAVEPESTGADVDGKMKGKGKGKIDIKKGQEMKLGRRLGRVVDRNRRTGW
ncbi:hypothetical protein LTR99_008256 [Exophiala xenobiotica]|uniref:Calpain catalytic domain-containing protein n=1 Tax=Vermiconidia calcicola TaxID=1690605 RepID=A0AAV9PSA0_9PEZI|nr:hypothetical protein LTR47_007581 [Exophiala xenobiotica]KAK5528404.1 hypothetical protein LTR25_010403 [Vermiconidia calcicola]KAK5539338.1 hypothetical protein LTR23_006559 [Chaetothyriales sp. CCFEE 6169]KAK5245564.1 hypothetical protein LTS06_009031 [Exophiala xenobiotica]KAK5297853.1 hypothetical protein LTR99_008256 [Exophiala xenobiotica]